MNKPIGVLIVEDSEDDALLLLRELRRGGYEPVCERVETHEAMKAALENGRWDIVISDYVLPGFSGLAALNILKESGQDLPFIIVSGNIGEDIAVAAMKAGAHDYIIKGNLTRLVPAVERELREADVRHEKQRAEEELKVERQRAEKALKEANETLERCVAERTVKLAQSEAELQRSNSDLQQFAYIASHDLQSPLRNVEGFVKLLARRYEGQLDAKADEFILHISNGVKDMQMLIHDILEYSKVDSGGKMFASVDMSLCVNKAISNLRAEIDEKNAEITHNETLPVVHGDAIQLTGLLQNLIGNAIKFSQEEPKVHISWKREGNRAVFTIQDNGIGMDMKDTDKIFAVFHRLHSKSEYLGTGIGLAICKKIVERHGGRIWVESEPGKGSTFFFTLPAL
jgi:light-regulated signal transduction histidine kinase (bacteriophytochrome)